MQAQGLIVSDLEVIRYVLQERGRFTAFLGAGASVEARVPTASQIAQEIYERLRENNPSGDEVALKEALNWDDPRRRYATSLDRYGNPAARVQYFRRLLRGREPAFCHHATALLMQRDVFQRTCLTTNFDKLIEVAFARQGGTECQAIRMKEEARFWSAGDRDRCYVVKLHGDYDTYNIRNTRDETGIFDPDLLGITERLLDDAGLVVVGAGGFEESVLRWLTELTAGDRQPPRLPLGVFWGVYAGPERPESLSETETEQIVQRAIDDGAVSKDIVETIRRLNTSLGASAFFPVWGAGRFLFSLMAASKDSDLLSAGELYLDHEMRLRNVFTKAGLSGSGVKKHLAALKEQQDRLAKRSEPDSIPEEICVARRQDPPTSVRMVYGDITSRALMASGDFGTGRRAVVSPEDTFVSAGGGVALSLLSAAGPQMILNELSKLAPIEHGEVAVTSGGNLPVQFIFHAAAIQVGEDAEYSVAQGDVTRAVAAALACVRALGVETIFVPLLGAGVGPLTPQESLVGILTGIADWEPAGHPLQVVIVVYRESVIPRADIKRALKERLPDFVIDEAGVAGAVAS